MTYTTTNFRTKKALKEAVASGKHETVFEPGLGEPIINGYVYLEGPHFPEPHKWYAKAQVIGGFIVPGSIS